MNIYVKLNYMVLLSIGGSLIMDIIIEFIFALFKSKDPEATAYNDFVNLLIFILLYFSAFVVFFWILSKLGLFS